MTTMIHSPKPTMSAEDTRDLNMNANVTFPLLAVSRHRIYQDGDGIFTLVAGAYCPLSCAYCINREVLAAGKIKEVTPEELYERVRIDNLYYLATDGGITFGGGEPLLYPDFIRAFAELKNPAWRINVETSLHVPPGNLSKLIGTVDKYYVDIKDCNGEIYKAYTGKDNSVVMGNLKTLYETEGNEKVIVRIPWIKGYNTRADVERSAEILREIGFDSFDFFDYLIPECFASSENGSC